MTSLMKRLQLVFKMLDAVQVSHLKNSTSCQHAIKVTELTDRLEAFAVDHDHWKGTARLLTKEQVENAQKEDQFVDI